MVAAVPGFPVRIRRRPHGGPAEPRRYERRRPEKTPLHKVISENLESWLAWREAGERPVPGYVEDELRGYLECGLLCFGFARAVCMTCRTGFVVAFSCKGRGVCPSCNGRHMAQTAAHLADHVIPPVPVRQWVISVPKRLRGMLADRPRAVAALTKIFLAEIERLLLATSGGTPDAETPRASRPRLGGISFLHRFGSALNHHVHLHACVTDGVFVPAADHAGCDAPPTFLAARPITPYDLTALTERVRRRVVRWFCMQRLLDAAAAADMLAWENSGFSVDASVRITLLPPQVRVYRQPLEHLLRYCARHKAANWVGRGRGRKSTCPGANGVVALTPFEFLNRVADFVPPPRKHRHRYHGVFAPNHKLRPAVTALAKREHRQAARSRGWRACGRRTTRGRLLRHSCEAPVARHLADYLGETHGPAGRGVPARVPSMWRRHPAHRLHHGAGADPEDPDALGRTTRTAAGVARPRTGHRLGRACPDP